MLCTHSSLLERPGQSISSRKACLGFGTGVELALFRARQALLDGWHFTPEEAMAYTGSCSYENSRSANTQTRAEAEDEVEDLPLYFGES